MSPLPLFNTWIDASRVWSEFGWRYSEMMFASAQVVAHRTDRMRVAGAIPNAKDREEFSRMKREKANAAVESVQAMAIESVLAGQRYAAFAIGQFFTGMPALFSLALPGTSRQITARRLRLVRNTVHRSAVSANKLSAATGRIVQQGLGPIRKRATANAKRLKRVR